jgi:hypothetical protein
MEVRRDKWIKIAREHIDYLKSIGADISNDKDTDYFVNCVNECTRIISKVRRSWKYDGIS